MLTTLYQTNINIILYNMAIHTYTMHFVLAEIHC